MTFRRGSRDPVARSSFAAARTGYSLRFPPAGIPGFGSPLHTGERSGPEVGPMCMSCGCGEVNERHKRGDITLSDLEKAGANHEMDIATVVHNIEETNRRMSSVP